jgi:hypothetical protein
MRDSCHVSYDSWVVEAVLQPSKARSNRSLLSIISNFYTYKHARNSKLALQQ